MKNKFKFFNGFSPIERDPNNGVTDQYLIDLDDEIWGYSDWIIRTLLRKDIESGIECLHVEFKDIDGNQYMCTIYDDKSLFTKMPIGEDLLFSKYLFKSIDRFKIASYKSLYDQYSSPLLSAVLFGYLSSESINLLNSSS